MARDLALGDGRRLEGEEEEDNPEWNDEIISDNFEEQSDEIETAGPLYVLPLYSLLSTNQQLRVFEPPPEGTRSQY